MGRRPRQYSQAERLAGMIRALAARACTINDLAQEFAVTRRHVLIRRLGCTLKDVAKCLRGDIATVSSLVSRYSDRMNDDEI